MTGKQPPWWNKRLTELRLEVKKWKRRAERNGVEETKECYRQTKREYKQEILRAKGEGWKKFCTEMNSTTSTARIHKLLKMGKREELGSMKDSNGKYTDTPEETLKVLLDYHYPDREPNINHEPEPDLNLDGLKNLDIDEVINLEAVKAAIKSFKPYKSPGMDGIYPALLQQGLEFLAEHILVIYKECLRTGKSPRRWLETKVSFIPKPGKQSYDEPNSIRPISLFSFLLKALERIIFWHLNKTCLRNKLSRNIFAYREGTSTEDALHNLTNKIEIALDNKEHCLVLFLDLSAAFSTLSVAGIIKKLKDMGCEAEILSWSKDMLESRIVVAFLNGDKVFKLVIRGTPQGGILSVIFWNVAGSTGQVSKESPYNNKWLCR